MQSTMIEQLNDPIANQTDWDCMKFSGPNFHSHKLHKDPQANLVFTATLSSFFSAGIFLLFSLSILVGIYRYSSGDHAATSGNTTFIFNIIGFLFGMAGYLLYRHINNEVDSLPFKSNEDSSDLEVMDA